MDVPGASHVQESMPEPSTEEQKLVRQILETLSKRDQQILAEDAKAGEPRPSDEFHAGELGISPAAAKKARQRAYKNFKVAYEERRKKLNRRKGRGD